VKFKKQNRRQEALNRGLNLRKGTKPSEILIKSLVIYSVSNLNLERLSSPMPTAATGLVFNNNDNNDILLQTHGPYHRHKITKSV